MAEKKKFKFQRCSSEDNTKLSNKRNLKKKSTRHTAEKIKKINRRKKGEKYK